MQVSAANSLADSQNSENAALPRSETTVFTAFGIGKSYVFYVEKESRLQRDKCWAEVFENKNGVWEFGLLKGYNKPLGEIVTLKLEACSEAQTAIEGLKKAFAESFPTVKCDKVEAFLFTTGVGVLAMRITTSKGADSEKLYDELPKIGEEDNISQKRIPLIQVCQQLYLNVMNQSINHKCETGKLQWSLYHLAQVDRSGEKTIKKYSYPLFYVDAVTYGNRTQCILQQVASSQRRYIQSNEARVSYRGSEVYVDWSEALVRDGENNRDLIEKNFIIGFASWCALLLMNINSSVFLLDAFAGMYSKRDQDDAGDVHHRTMAYKDVADAILPIRWTTSRRDLFLLETIHHNWSSERVRQNVDERMKLLALHYTRLDDKSREQFNQKREDSNRRLSIIAVTLTVVAFVSAIADVTNLWAAYNQTRSLLASIAFHVSLALLVLTVSAILALFIGWLVKGRSSKPTKAKATTT